MVAIAPTDLDWYRALRHGPLPKVVNFWTPTPWNIQSLKPGDKFCFLLKAPFRRVGGFGEFLRYENMHASKAWRAFGLGNGVDSFAELVARTRKYTDKSELGQRADLDPLIGCILLQNVVLLDESQFFTPDAYGMPFPRQVVKLKYFPDIDTLPVEELAPVLGEARDFGLVPYRRRATRSVTVGERRGQPAFRQRLLVAYGGRCAISGEDCGELLEAAHIQPYVDERSNHVQNGIVLRVDLHRLFDAGLLTITPDHEVKISPRLRSETYGALGGTQARLPERPDMRPSREALLFHNQSVFRA